MHKTENALWCSVFHLFKLSLFNDILDILVPYNCTWRPKRALF